MGKLYFGDNLDVLRKHVRDESVDLIYLDPPFNSNATYNVLYKSPLGVGEDAQVRAFKDMWRWEEDGAELALEELREADVRSFQMLESLRAFLGESDLMAYLAMMAIRLVELRKALKPTGSIYLHCDPSASHYIKILMDGIFGPGNFRNEIIWKRTSAHSSAKRFGPVHDVILFYTASDRYTWNKVFQPYDQTYIDEFYTHYDRDGRRWRRSDLTGAGVRRGETGKTWRGLDVTAKGRHWAYPPSELEEMDRAGKIHWPQKAGGMPMLKRYLMDQPGVPAQDVIADIPPMHNLSSERLGYQTQKPLALLNRIIQSSSNEGDVILDPFCGCGTAIHAAEDLKRNWIGIDVAYAAILVIEDRLKTYFPRSNYDVDGIPHGETAARALARLDPHTFQQWAVGRVGGQPRGRGADRGIDGEIIYQTGTRTHGRAIVSVKAGQHVNPDMVRALKGVVERERADIGIFVCVDEPSREMRKEAVTSGHVELPGGRRTRIQIVTVKDLIDGPNLGIPTRLNSIQAARAALAVASKKAKRKPAKDLREEPPLPPMAIAGEKKAEPVARPAKSTRKKATAARVPVKRIRKRN